ncbi:DUF5998 family protein [Paeniglutamicibacter cryotolerans]|uniref:Cell wall biosynthesis glycosyltransferase n=1 Tax=Paeniglutamicibacter cryotolerans TaxID=670079 RepID=A0A839QTT2_9MICC|nr:DUF5998 family protein [Paeniglutamicibacter cryotolerans]MBB2996682.1 hypothetical protein [Paeniglutamicibacter cryotolerans]
MTSRTSAPGRDLHSALDRAGFYPRMVADVVEDALDGRDPVSHLIHLETHFDRNEVHRHITVLVLTADVLVIAHVDDQMLDDMGEQVMAQVSTETIPVSRIASVVLSYVYHQPQNYKSSDKIRELTVGMSWSGGQRIDLAPAGCGDPECDADHGYTGTSQQEDLVLRVSAEADGAGAVEDARTFAKALRRASISPAEVHAPSVAPEQRGRVGSRFARGLHQG